MGEGARRWGCRLPLGCSRYTWQDGRAEPCSCALRTEHWGSDPTATPSRAPAFSQALPLQLEGHSIQEDCPEPSAWRQWGGGSCGGLASMPARLCLELRLPGPSAASADRPPPLPPDCRGPCRALMARAPRPAFTMLLRGPLPPVVSAMRLPRPRLLCRRPQGLVPCLPQGLRLVCHCVLKTEGWTPGPGATLTPSSGSLSTPASGRHAAQRPGLGGQEPKVLKVAAVAVHLAWGDPWQQEPSDTGLSEVSPEWLGPVHTCQGAHLSRGEVWLYTSPQLCFHKPHRWGCFRLKLWFSFTG